MSIDLSEQIHAAILDLDPKVHPRVLKYLRSLSHRPQGTPLSAVVSVTIGISSDDLDLMQNAVDDGCERIDSGEW